MNNFISNMNGNEKLNGVGCNVVSCKFNSDDYCCAEHINVKNETAIKKAETFCGTFAPKDTSC